MPNFSSSVTIAIAGLACSLPSCAWSSSWVDLKGILDSSADSVVPLAEGIEGGDTGLTLKTGTTLDGCGHTLFWGSSSFSTSPITMLAGSTLKDITLKYTSEVAANSRANGVIFVNHAGDVTLDTVKIEDFIIVSGDAPGLAGLHVQDVGTVRISGSAFIGNESRCYYGGGAIHIGSAKQVLVERTIFKNNLSGKTGGAVHMGNLLAIAASSPQLQAGDFIFRECAFLNNTSVGVNIISALDGTGGAVTLNQTRSPVFFIDTDFIGNKAHGNDNSMGGGIFAYWTSYNRTYGTFYGIETPSMNWVIAAENRNVTFSGNTAVEGNDIFLYASGVRFQAAPGKVISFDGGIAGAGTTYSRININLPDQRYTDTDGTAKTLPYGGTILFRAPVTDTLIQVYGGTICLDDAGENKGNELAYSSLAVKDAFTLSTVHPATVSSASARMTRTSFLQDIRIGNLTMERDAKLAVDVDLLEAKGDTFTAGSSSQSNGHRFLVSSFNILQDALPETMKVDVALVPDTSDPTNPMLEILGLADEAATAVFDDGVFRSVWDVTYAEEDKKGVYTFRRNGPQQPVNPPSNPEEPVTPIDPPVVPSDPEAFSPGVFVPAAAYQGIDVIQHAIAAGAFSQKLGSAITLEREPGKQYLWAYAKGADMNVSPKGYGSFESRYALTMLGMETDLRDDPHSRLGVYAGAVRAQQEKHSVWKVNQNGAFIGISGGRQGETFFLRFNTDFGVINSKSSSIADHGQFTTYWFGAGLEAGAAFLPTADVRIEPALGVSFLHLFESDYTSARGIRFDVGRTESIEFYPQIDAVLESDGHWKGLLHARYTFVKQNASDVLARGIRVPELDVGNYTEFGLGAIYSDSDFSVDIRINRTELNRQGWNGSLLLTKKF